jgi:hypothetical protein
MILCKSLKANTDNIKAKIWRTVWPLSFSAIIFDPNYPQTKEKITAVRMKFQFLITKDIGVITPLNDEKTRYIGIIEVCELQ